FVHQRVDGFSFPGQVNEPANGNERTGDGDDDITDIKVLSYPLQQFIINKQGTEGQQGAGYGNNEKVLRYLPVRLFHADGTAQFGSLFGGEHIVAFPFL